MIADPNSAAISPPQRWGPERRREFIDFRLRWDGKINRAEVAEHFGISLQQASSDLSGYSEVAPENLVYDKSAKVYRAGPTFKPVSVASDASHYLGQLMEMASGAEPSASRFIGWAPPCDVVRHPARRVDEPSLLRVVRAVRDREDILVSYQSMRRPTASAAWIGPHAFGSDGLRWHVRAWSYEERAFRDFVLSRVRGISNARPSGIDPAEDVLWSEYINIVIRPRDGLTKDQRQALETDYAMCKGRLAVRCRKALAWYVLRQLHLDQSSPVPILEQPLEYESTPELSRLIASARKHPEHSFTSPVNQEI